MPVRRIIATWRRILGGAALLAATACAGGGRTYTLNNDNNGDTLSLAVGDRIVLYLGTVGPGSYLDSATISNPVLGYTPVPYGGPATPAGSMTEHHFLAVWPGTARVEIPWAENGTVNPARAFAFQVRVTRSGLPN